MSDSVLRRVPFFKFSFSRRSPTVTKSLYGSPSAIRRISGGTSFIESAKSLSGMDEIKMSAGISVSVPPLS